MAPVGSMTCITGNVPYSCCCVDEFCCHVPFRRCTVHCRTWL